MGRHWGEGEVWTGEEGHYFKWELSLDLKQSRVSAATTSSGRLFQSGLNLGKDDICLYCVRQEGLS